jgi:Tol biopolymer transport system component
VVAGGGRGTSTAPAAGGGRGATAAAPAATPILGNAPIATGDPVAIDTGALTHISRVHGLSADGTQIIFVDHPPGTPRPPANTYLVPLAGGAPKLLTPNTGAGSTLSPDGKTFVYDTDTVADIYTIPVDGSTPATRLTTGLGKNYGPQFSHDGSFILFCSDRSGSMQIWRMKPDGTEPVQLTKDDNNNWFPHLSPNDASALMITYPPGVTADSPHAAVQIRRLNLSTGAIDLMARILGGPASAPTWSPNSAQITFVTEQWVN